MSNAWTVWLLAVGMAAQAVSAKAATARIVGRAARVPLTGSPLQQPAI